MCRQRSVSLSLLILSSLKPEQRSQQSTCKMTNEDTCEHLPSAFKNIRHLAENVSHHTEFLWHKQRNVQQEAAQSKVKLIKKSTMAKQPAALCYYSSAKPFTHLLELGEHTAAGTEL